MMIMKKTANCHFESVEQILPKRKVSRQELIAEAKDFGFSMGSSELIKSVIPKQESTGFRVVAIHDPEQRVIN